MSEKRRDTKNRILRTGESQRADGRYAYKYKDAFGTQRFVYSWKLEATDKLPKGKRECKALRELEKEILKDLDDGIITSDMTVIELIDSYISSKKNVRVNTQYDYTMYRTITSRNPIGRKYVRDVKVSDAKKFIIELKATRKYSTVQTFRGFMYSVFQRAIEDDIIRKNPFNFKLDSVIDKDVMSRESLTTEQENIFLDFIKSDSKLSKYYNAIYVLLNTGLRVSELAGLTVSDIDFQKNIIRVERQAYIDSFTSKLCLSPPKTTKGMRSIPMLPGVADALKGMIEACKKFDKGIAIDGVTGFIHLNRNGVTVHANGWISRFRTINARLKADVDPEFPHITPHILRHTFCTKLIRAGVAPQTVQYVMGHQSLSVTLNVYTHINPDFAAEEVGRVFSNLSSVINMDEVEWW